MRQDRSKLTILSETDKPGVSLSLRGTGNLCKRRRGKASLFADSDSARSVRKLSTKFLRKDLLPLLLLPTFFPIKSAGFPLGGLQAKVKAPVLRKV